MICATWASSPVPAMRPSCVRVLAAVIDGQAVCRSEQLALAKRLAAGEEPDVSPGRGCAGRCEPPTA